MAKGHTSDRVEIPPPAAECLVCSREWIPLDELRLVEVASLYLDSHESAGLERCEVCGKIYLRAWHEAYDDSWRHYLLSDGEVRRQI